MKLNSRQAVIEKYWVDYLVNCLHSRLDHERSKQRKENPLFIGQPKLPTEDGFWTWYISEDGPMGVQYKCMVYSKDRHVYA